MKHCGNKEKYDNENSVQISPAMQTRQCKHILPARCSILRMRTIVAVTIINIKINIKIKESEEMNMKRVEQFLKEAGTYYLATVEGDQPRVRPFGTAHIFEDKLYIQTGKVKDVSKQLHANPKAEICAFKDGEWLRVAGELIEDDRVEARQSMLDAYPSLQKMYKADDGNTEVFYFKNATATFSSFTHAPETVKF